MINIDEKLTKELIKTTDALRKKYKALRTGREAYETEIEETLRPITRPLNELVKKSNTKQGEQNQNYFIESPINKTKRKFKQQQVQENGFESPTKEKYLRDEFITPNTFVNSSPELTDSITPKRPKKNLNHRNFSELILQEEFHDTPKKYVDLFINNSNTLDKTYGVYSKDEKWYIGNGELIILGKDIQIKNKTFEGTNGLYELIFKKIPDKSIYTDEDLKNYKTILYETNTHRVGHDSHGQIRGNRGHKYTKIIRKLLGFNTNTSNNPTHSLSTPQSGNGLMQLSKLKKDYIFWDNPNELVDRMRLLIASQQAGNNNHSNEIVSIIEELKEADIIE